MREIWIMALAASFFAAAHFLPSATRADDAVKPVQIAVVALRSADSAGKFLKNLGIDVPYFTAAGLEQSWPFIGQGGVATDKPIGIVVYAAPEISTETMAFVIPVKPAGATADILKTHGAEPMPGHPDTFLLRNVNIANAIVLRRTANHLVITLNPQAAQMIDVDAIADAVKDPQTVARMTADAKALRKAMPDFLTKAGHFLVDRQAAEILSAMLGALKPSYEGADRIDFALNVGKEGAAISLAMSPATLPAPAAGNRPGMPAAIFARVDLAAAPRAALPGINALLADFAQDAADDPDKNFTDKEKKQIVALMERLTALAVDSAASSVGIELVEGEPVFYIAQHWSKQVDVAAEIRDISAGIQKIRKLEPGNRIESQNYEADGVKVARFVAQEHGKVVNHFDVVQNSADVLIEAGAGETRRITSLLAVANNSPGPAAAVLSAWVDLGKLFDQLGKLPDAPLAGLPPDLQKQFADLARDQKVHIELLKAGDGIRLEVKAVHALLENIPKLVEIFKAKRLD